MDFSVIAKLCRPMVIFRVLSTIEFHEAWDEETGDTLRESYDLVEGDLHHRQAQVMSDGSILLYSCSHPDYHFHVGAKYIQILGVGSYWTDGKARLTHLSTGDSFIDLEREECSRLVEFFQDFLRY